MCLMAGSNLSSRRGQSFCGDGRCRISGRDSTRRGEWIARYRSRRVGSDQRERARWWNAERIALAVVAVRRKRKAPRLEQRSPCCLSRLSLSARFTSGRSPILNSLALDDYAHIESLFCYGRLMVTITPDIIDSISEDKLPESALDAW